MLYQLYKLKFPGNVHFGTDNLEETGISFRADTLFSALCLEAQKFGRIEELYQMVQSGELIFSDSFPYMGKCLYLPKPCIRIERGETSGNSAEKKLFKKMKFIPLDDLDKWLDGSYIVSRGNSIENLGEKGVKVLAAIRGMEEPQPYQVRYYEFHDGNGLYFIAGASAREALDMLNDLMDSLSCSGIGGKRYAGFGRFECRISEVPKKLVERLEQKADRYMLLSCALPKAEELETVLADADYHLIRRGGFVASDSYADQQMRKKDLYVFEAGSCFSAPFAGKVYDVSHGGRHPVYRYARGMFMGVRV